MSINRRVDVDADELDAGADLTPIGDEREAHVRLAAAGVDHTDALAPQIGRSEELDVVPHPPLFVAEIRVARNSG